MLHPFTLQVGDQIISINEESLEELTHDAAVQLLRTASSPVVLYLLHGES